MKRLLIYTSALALMAGAISPLSAHEYGGGGSRHFRHRNRIIVQPATPVLPLAALMLGQLLAQPQQCCQQVAEPLVFPDDPAPTKKFYRPIEPKLRQDSPIPMK